MARRKNGKPKVTPDLSAAKLNKGAFVPMTQSGFCQFGPGPAHMFCTLATCTCESTEAHLPGHPTPDN